MNYIVSDRLFLGKIEMLTHAAAKVKIQGVRESGRTMVSPWSRMVSSSRIDRGELIVKRISFLCLIGILIGCAPKRTKYSTIVVAPVTNPQAKIVSDLSFPIGAREEKEFYYRFADRDTVILSAWAIEGKDISELSIVKWPSTVVFSSWAVPMIENEKIFISQEAVYSFVFRNSSLLSSKVCGLTIHRVPSEEELIDFDTAVEWDTVYDTTHVTAIESVLVHVDTIPEELISTQRNLGSQLSGSTRSHIQVTLPKNTAYWVYWIGADQEAARGLQGQAALLPELASMLGIANPVAAFAIGILPELFTATKGQDISYCFILDYDNLTRFLGGYDFRRLKYGRKIVTDYARMENPTEGTFYLGLDNSYSMMTSKTVAVRIVAVRMLPEYEIREVQKPEVNVRILPKRSE